MMKHLSPRRRGPCRWYALLGLAALLGFSAPIGASQLGDMAAQMKPGEWRVLNQSGDASGWSYDLLVACKPDGTDCADNILNFADKGLWNPNTREIHFIGKGHMRAAKHVVYTEAMNRWTQEPLPAAFGGDYGLAHGYEHSAIDPTSGNVYARLFNSTQVFRWTRATKTWTQLPSAPNPSVAVAIEYFPELGGLLLVGGGEVHLYRESSGSWTRLAQGLTMGDYHNVASYNPVHKVAIVGGGNGSNRLYRVSATGAVTPIATAPADVGILASVFTVDPASGKHLLFTSGGGFYEYDVGTNSWTAANAASVAMFAGSNAYNNRILYRVAVPISTYGIVAFLTLDGSSAKVYLYRHAPGAAAPPLDTTPPSPPATLNVQ
jgi:hypothetical protein